MYKLVALDLDGTLLNPQGKLSERVIRAIRRVEAKGILVTLMTGRAYPSIRAIVMEFFLEKKKYLMV